MEKQKIETTKEVVLIDESRLNLWEDNPRENDGAPVEKLAELLEIHGFVTPLTVWEENMVVYKGNTTLKAARKVGIEEIPVVLKDFDSKEAAAAYALADNKSSEWAEWDDETLMELMQADNIAEEFDPKNTGFTEEELKSFRQSTGDLSDVEVPDVEIEGEADVGKSDYMVIQFESKEQREKVLEKYGFKIVGYRKIPWNDLIEKISSSGGKMPKKKKRKKKKRRR